MSSGCVRFFLISLLLPFSAFGHAVGLFSGIDGSPVDTSHFTAKNAEVTLMCEDNYLRRSVAAGTYPPSILTTTDQAFLNDSGIRDMLAYLVAYGIPTAFYLSLPQSATNLAAYCSSVCTTPLCKIDCATVLSDIMTRSTNSAGVPINNCAAQTMLLRSTIFALQGIGAFGSVPVSASFNGYNQILTNGVPQITGHAWLELRVGLCHFIIDKAARRGLPGEVGLLSVTALFPRNGYTCDTAGGSANVLQMTHFNPFADARCFNQITGTPSCFLEASRTKYLFGKSYIDYDYYYSEAVTACASVGATIPTQQDILRLAPNPADFGGTCYWLANLDSSGKGMVYLPSSNSFGSRYREGWYPDRCRVLCLTNNPGCRATLAPPQAAAPVLDPAPVPQPAPTPAPGVPSTMSP